VAWGPGCRSRGAFPRRPAPSSRRAWLLGPPRPVARGVACAGDRQLAAPGEAHHRVGSAIAPERPPASSPAGTKGAGCRRGRRNASRRELSLCAILTRSETAPVSAASSVEVVGVGGPIRTRRPRSFCGPSWRSPAEPVPSFESSYEPGDPVANSSTSAASTYIFNRSTSSLLGAPWVDADPRS
jgi:hypothetical protein